MITIIRYIPHFAALIIIICKGAGCTFSGVPVLVDLTPETVNSFWEDASLATPNENNLYTIYEDRQVKILHGAACVLAGSALEEDNVGNETVGVRVNGSLPMGTAYDTATVFLNGWRTMYRNDDHHVLGISTAIFDIEQDENELRWKAGGVMSDKNGDDGYRWCYHFTALFWQSGPFDIDIAPIDSDVGAGLTFLSTDNSNPYSSYKSDYNQLADFEEIPGALLPRGFGVIWGGDRGDYDDRGIDHHLLQFALKYGDFGTITSEDGSGTDLFWRFETVYRDEDLHRDYVAAQVVSTMTGDSVRFEQPDFAIEPRGPYGQNSGDEDVVTDTISIPYIPFDYAVPVLTGWDIGDFEKDIHIKDIGVWIESFDYNKEPDAETGTLTYTIKSVFIDKGGLFSSAGAYPPRYQVSILGINRMPSNVNTNPSPTTGTIDEPLSDPPAPRPDPIVVPRIGGPVLESPPGGTKGRK